MEQYLIIWQNLRMRSIVTALLLLFPVLAHADTFSDFKTRVTQGLVKPFALDLGGILGGTSFHNGRNLGVLGFEAGVVGDLQGMPDKDDHILKDAGVKTFGMPVLHAAVGLPYGFDLAVHGLEYSHLSLVGGGLRYQVYDPGLVTGFLPHVGVAFWGDKASHNDFKASHYGLNAAASWNVPFVAPFAGVGLDITRLTVGTSAAVPALAGFSANAVGSRFDAGVDIKLIPFTRITTAFMLLHGMPAGRFSLEVQL